MISLIIENTDGTWSVTDPHFEGQVYDSKKDAITACCLYANAILEEVDRGLQAEIDHCNTIIPPEAS